MLEFDYIIVGAGIGGLVVATRLTEDENCSVLLVEAGQDRRSDARISIPGMMATMYGDPTYDWDYMSEPQVCNSRTPLYKPESKLNSICLRQKPPDWPATRPCAGRFISHQLWHYHVSIPVKFRSLGEAW